MCVCGCVGGNEGKGEGRDEGGCEGDEGGVRGWRGGGRRGLTKRKGHWETFLCRPVAQILFCTLRFVALLFWLYLF